MTLWWLVSFFALTLLVAVLASRIKGVEKPSKINVRDTPLQAISLKKVTDERRDLIQPQAEDVVYNGIRLISGILTQRISLEKPLAMIISLILIGAACVIYTIAISSTMGFISARDLRV